MFLRKIVLMMVMVMVTMIPAIHGFSSGVSLVTGDSVFRRVYCQRPVSQRAPIHLSPDCRGPCRPRSDGNQFFSLEVNETTYWEDGVNVTLQAKEGSEFDVRGFTLFAVDDQGVIVGLFDTVNDDVAYGSCEDVIKNTVEGQFAVHSVARPGRKTITLLWKPDGLNHGTIKFRAWVVHNHTTIFYVESHELTNEKNSDEPLDLIAMYQSLLHDTQANMAQFENAFTQRGNMGYQMHLEDPFAPFNQPPTLEDLLPKAPMNRGGANGGGGGFGSPVVDNSAIDSGIINFRNSRKNGRGRGGRNKNTERTGSESTGKTRSNGEEDDFQLISIGEWMKARGQIDKIDTTKRGDRVSKDDRIIINNLLLVGVGGGQRNDNEIDTVSPNENSETVPSKTVKERTNPTNTMTEETTENLSGAEKNNVTKDAEKQTFDEKKGNVFTSDDNLIAPPDEDAMKVRKPVTEQNAVNPDATNPGVIDNQEMELLSRNSGVSISKITPDNSEPKLHFLQKRDVAQDEPQVQAMQSSSNSRNTLDIFGSPSSSSSSSSPSSSSRSSNQPPPWAMPPQMSQPANPNQMRGPNGAAGNPRGGPGASQNSPFMPQGGRNNPAMQQRGMNGMPMNPASMQQQRPPFGQQSQSMPFPNQGRQMQQPGGFPMPNQNGQQNPMMMMGQGRPSQQFPMGPQSGQLPFGSNGPMPMQRRDGDDENPFGAAPMNPFQRMQNPGASGQFPQQPPGFGGNPQMGMGPSMGGPMGQMMGNQNPMMSQMMNGMGGQQGFPGSQMGMMSGPGGSMNSPYGQSPMGMNGGSGFSSNPFSSMGMASMMGGRGGMNGQSPSPFGFPNTASMLGGGMGNFRSNSGSSSRGMPGMMNPFMGMSGSSRGGFPGMMPSMQNMGSSMSRMASMYGGMPSSMGRMSSLMSRRGMGGFGSMSGMGGMFQRGGGMTGMMPGMMPGFMGGSRSG